MSLPDAQHDLDPGDDVRIQLTLTTSTAVEE